MDTSLKKSGAKTIPVTTAGLDTFLVETLKSLFRDNLKTKFVLIPEQNGLICITQIKSSADLAALKEYQQNFPGRPVIAFKRDVKPVQGENIISVPFPVTPRKILQALDQAVDSLNSAATSKAENKTKKPSSAQPSAPRKPQIISVKEDEKYISSRGDIDLSDAKMVDKLRYSDEKYLLGQLKRAYAKGQANNTNIQIYTAHGVFQYYPRQHKAHVEVNNDSLRNLASLPDSVTSIMTEFDDEKVPVQKENKKLVDADALLWKVAVWASRGRLPVETDLDQSFCLKHWPNLTRWMMVPHAMEMTVLWLSAPHSLRQTVEILGIPQHNVFSFYNAALDLGLINFDVVKSRQTANKTPKMHVPSRLKKFIGKITDYVSPTAGEAA